MLIRILILITIILIKKLKAVIKDLLNRYEILTTNPTKDL